MSGRPIKRTLRRRAVAQNLSARAQAMDVHVDK